MVSREHVKRIKEELSKAGATRYGLLKSESRHLPKVIHEDEHIKGVVYGQFESNSAMLVATDKRVIYLDCKPMAILMDDITYDVVQGVEFDVHTIFATLVMQTNIGNYTVRYANIQCASRFADYLEERKLSMVRKVTGPDTDFVETAGRSLKKAAKSAISSTKPAKKVELSGIELTKWDEEFLLHHSIGVLSTVDRAGNAYGSTVYYVYTDEAIYITTKASTQKARNVYVHNQVGFTIFDEQHLQTMQISGIAEMESSQKTKNSILKYMTQPKVYRGEEKLPPVTKNEQDAYLVLKIKPLSIKFSDFN